jgi:hypothetical protein
MLKAKSENIKNAVVHFNYEKKPGNNSNLVLLIILQQTIGCSKMVLRQNVESHNVYVTKCDCY